MTAIDGLSRFANQPVDARGLALLRALFGAVLVFATARFAAMGWIDELYLTPSFHFTYFGFSWVRPLPAGWMYAEFAIMGLAALALMVGFWTRPAAFVFLIGFAHVELIEKAAYLNHYYFVSLMALLFVFLPSNRALSADSWLARRKLPGELPARPAVGAWAYWLPRAQVAIVYGFAGLAKVNSDWLFRAEPLKTWLAGMGELPVFGSLLGASWVAYLMSWSGAAYDLAIVPLLLWRRSRRIAYLAAVLFHVTIWLLFPIGVFSWVMLVATTIFFAPDWPASPIERLRRGLRLSTEPARLASEPPLAPARVLPRAAYLTCAGYFLLQFVLPLRFLAYPGYVNWTEQAYRFAWRVMLIEKTGRATFRVETDDPSARFVIYPRTELTPLQLTMMSTQPDMIQEYAHHLAARFESDGYAGVRVYADVYAALNGRRAQRLIDPSVDLAAEPRSIGPKPWIVPLVSDR